MALSREQRAILSKNKRTLRSSKQNCARCSLLLCPCFSSFKLSSLVGDLIPSRHARPATLSTLLTAAVEMLYYQARPGLLHTHFATCVFLLLVLISIVTAAKERHTIKINGPNNAPPPPPRISTTDTATTTTTTTTINDTTATTLAPPIALLPLLSHQPPPPSTPPAHPNAESFLTLATACYTHTTDTVDQPTIVTTTVCPFNNITQQQHITATTASSSPLYHSTQLLGVWSGWLDSERTDEVVQRFDGGGECTGTAGVGDARTALLRVRCGESVSVAAVVELRRCQYTVVLYTPVACPHLPLSKPILAEMRGGARESEGAGDEQVGDVTVDVADLQSCIDELSQAEGSERSMVPCARHWNAVRTRLDEASLLGAKDSVEVKRVLYPYNRKRVDSDVITNSDGDT